MALIPLLNEISACALCRAHLPLGPRPVVTASASATILIIGQAPGTRVHETGVPWNDASGDRLREWMQLGRDQFYDDSQIAIMPMGFCYPGKGKSGDLPPRSECAPTWHAKLLAEMPNIELTLLIGQYAQRQYLSQKGGSAAGTLTENVAQFEGYLPDYLPLPHPSPRNRYWLAQNPWFEREVLPALRNRVHQIIKS